MYQIFKTEEMTEKENLLNDLKSDELEKRLYAADDLFEFLDESVIYELISALEKEKEQIVKEVIVTSLTEGVRREESFTDHTYSYLFHFFKLDDEYLRNQTITILGAGKNNVVQFLKSKYESSDKDVRKLILDTLLLIKSPEAIEVLRVALIDEDINNQITAIEYLATLNDSQLVNHLESILANKFTSELMLVQVAEAALQMLK